MGQIAKLSSDCAVTLPKWALEALGNPSQLEIEVEDGRLVLTPANSDTLDAIRQHVEALGVTEQDVQDAVAWARRAP